MELSAYNQGLLASLLAGLSTGIGSLIAFAPPILIKKYYGLMLGFCAGLMLAATAFALVMPGVEFAMESLHFSKLTAAGILAGGMILGWGVFVFLHHFLHFHDLFKESLEKRTLWLFIMAITLHNIPEGMTVGASFTGEKLIDGIAVALGITLQNIPEGLAVSATLLSLGYSKLFTIGMTLLSGLAEPVGALFSLELVSLSKVLLPITMAFAAGIMLTVITEDIIPQAYKQNNKPRRVTLSLLIGFLTMMFLDIIFS